MQHNILSPFFLLLLAGTFGGSNGMMVFSMVPVPPRVHKKEGTPTSQTVQGQLQAPSHAHHGFSRDTPCVWSTALSQQSFWSEMRGFSLKFLLLRSPSGSFLVEIRGFFLLQIGFFWSEGFFCTKWGVLVKGGFPFSVPILTKNNTPFDTKKTPNVAKNPPFFSRKKPPQTRN